MQHRDNNFDFLRVAAAFAVLASHQFALSGLPEPRSPIGSWGGTGVLVFFAISGYLVASSWVHDPNLPRFVARRLLRIWPGLLVALVLVALVQGPLVSSLAPADYYQSPLTWTYFRQLDLWHFQDRLPGIYPGNPLAEMANGSLWTIPIEVRCYLVLALVGMVSLLRRFWVLPLAFLATAFWFFFLYKVGYEHPIRMHLQMGMVFFCAASLYQLHPFWEPRRRMVMAASFAAILLLWFTGWQEIAATLGLPIAVVLLGTGSTPVLRRTGRYGDISYGLYIYAYPVQQTWVWLTRNGYPVWSGLLVCTGVTVVLAWMSWKLVEQPALRFKPGRPARPAAAAQVAAN